MPQNLMGINLIANSLKTLLPGLSVKPKYESNSLSLVVGSFLFFSFLFPLFLLIL